MKKIILLPFLLATILLLAQDKQDDLVFVVNKRPPVTIAPVDMHLESGIPRGYRIKGIPPGCTVLCDLDGSPIRVTDGTLILQAENNSRQPRLADLHIRIRDQWGDVEILNRKCYIHPAPLDPHITTQGEKLAAKGHAHGIITDPSLLKRIQLNRQLTGGLGTPR